MRKTRFGAVLASTALASVTVLGAGTAMAQEGDAPEPVSITSEGNYTMTATQTGQCDVTFTLESLRGEDNPGNWRGDYRVGDEEPITQVEEVNPAYGNRGTTYRPVISNQQGVADAIENRENSYDFGAGTVTVDLTQDRTVPYADGDPNEVYTLPGVQANENGEHTITFGVYQGPVRQDSAAYDEVGEITVTGCPVLTLPERISSEFNLPDFSELSRNLSS